MKPVCDLTTVRNQGDGTVADDMSVFGLNKDTADIVRMGFMRDRQSLDGLDPQVPQLETQVIDLFGVNVVFVAQR